MKGVVFNCKGGVGKSSIVVNLAAISAARGFKTLVLDLDAQANSTHYLLGEAPLPDKANLAAFFEQYLSFKLLMDNPMDFITPTPWENLSIVASSPKLGELQHRLEIKYKIYKLRDAVQRYAQHFDHIYFDTPPALNFYTLSALIAADCCLIPFDCDRFSRRALDSLLDQVSEIRADHNDGLKVEGIVVNQFMTGANLPKRMVAQMKDEKLPVLDTLVASSVKMRESHECCKPLIHLFPKHKLTQSLIDLFNELHGTSAK